MKRFINWLVVVALVLINMVHVGHAAKYNDLEAIIDKGKIVMGTSPDFPPFEWLVIEDGEQKVVGIDADLSKLIAEELGVELVIEEMAFDSLIESVKIGKIDMSLAGMTYTKDRAKQVDFSDVYYDADSKIIMLADADEEKFKTIEDLADQRIGVQRGTIQHELIQELLPDAEIISMKSNIDVIEGLKTDRIDAVVLEGIVTDEFIAAHKGAIKAMENIEVSSEEEGNAVIVAKGNQELLEVINKVIKDAKESGELDEIVKRNLEKSGNEE